ncbi:MULTISPECIES: mercury(II) reductase [Micromonospora]|uniref:mercury(II) reductase n=1 Tax=Micromonospora TaxID=1873 RepID=UPI000828BAAD|nr:MULTISPECIES: mercury(II) reductase [Micromonospora]MDG4756219.1 mercury(II) reductase [Micromonospora sp. WMMD718]SCL43302.1 mercuric reductase [Micromonospora aurantiaca]
MADNDDVDLAVVGSGGAAMAAAIAARQAGARVVLIERAVLGGTCVNVGCVPSKTLLAAAGTRHAALSNPFPGAPTSADGVDLRALVGQKDELVGRLRQAKYGDVAAAYGFEVRPGQARFTDGDTLTIDDRPLRARAYVIATGAEPARPDLPGLGEVDYLTSTTAMEQSELPDSLVVVGGGYVGMEQAQLFAHLGTRVTLVGRLAPRAEPELAEALRAVFADDGITMLEEHATEVQRAAGGVEVVTASGRRASGQRLLVATGRRARTDGLDLAVAGVKTDERGFVVVDAAQRTTNPRVYAAGDVTGAPQYVYVAAATGRVAAVNALAGDGTRPARLDYTGLPSVVFTRPQLASAGLTEADALAAGHDCACRILDLADVPRALVNRDTRGAVKVVADANTGRVLGVHALADGAGEMMLAATYAIKAGMTVDDIADTWAPYLTMAESLRITAGTFRNELPTSCCA